MCFIWVQIHLCTQAILSSNNTLILQEQLRLNDYIEAQELFQIYKHSISKTFFKK